MRYPFFFGIAVSGVVQFGSLFYPPRAASSKKKHIPRIFFEDGRRRREEPFRAPALSCEGKIPPRSRTRSEDAGVFSSLDPPRADDRAFREAPEPAGVTKELSRYRGIRLGAPALLALIAAAGCGERSDIRIARRILDNHRRHARVKPLPAAQVVRLLLSSPAGREAASGTGRIEWDGPNYRETVASAGWTLARGIQAGKAYWTDEDGVTRVASEPVLRELATRSYFWRRAYLFDDLERAGVALGPADERTVSVDLTPRGGNTLRLIFATGGELISTRSPRFYLEFRSPSRFTDRSRPDRPVEAEVRSITLPSDSLADTLAGGWSARWTAVPAEAALVRIGAAGVGVDGRIALQPARIALDAAAEGPFRLRPALASRLGLSARSDVFGRRIARGGPITIGALSYTELFLEISDEVLEGADAEAGAVFYRETIVELEGAAGRIRFHDPARWSAPPGYFRGLLDDDGDRPVAILRLRSGTLRLRAGTSATTGILLAPESARPLGLSAPGSRATDLKWGTATFPSTAVRIEESAFDAAWGDDGALGFDLLLRFHVFLDMPRRWAYLQPHP